MTLSREFSEEVSPPAEAVPAAPNTSKPVRKATRTFFVFNIRGSVEKASDSAYPPKGGYAARLSCKQRQRAVWARAIPARVSAAPVSWTPSRDSPSQAQATRIATTGSSIATIAVRVAPMRGSAPTTSANGTIDPRSTIQPTRNQTGACKDRRWPRSDVRPSNARVGNDHHGSAIAQNAEENRNPHASSESGSRLRVARSAVSK